MRILITGATGFLGRTLCDRLRSEEHEVVALSSATGDLRNQHALNQFDRLAFDVIYHLAAWTQAGDFCLYHPGEQWTINQQINTNMLAWWQSRQPQAKLVCIGSSCAYDVDLPLMEEHYLTGRPIESLLAYAMSKRMLYVGALSLAKQFDMKYVYLVPSTLYGPGYHTDGRQMHFIFDMIRKIMRGKVFGEPVILWGDGNQTRELVYVNDFVDIMVWLVGARNNDIINIGAGEEYTIRHFAKLLCERIGYDYDAIDFDESRYVGATSKCLVVDKLRRLRPDLHMTSLDDGLSLTVNWFWRERKVLL